MYNIEKNMSLDMKQLSKELHRPFSQVYPRRKVFVSGIDNTWAMDLVDMSEWKDYNDGYAWMLNIVDVFSRYAWSVYLKDKSAAIVLKAFQDVIKKYGRKPSKIWVDDGKEFHNKLMDEYIKKQKIIRYGTYSDHKSTFVERFNRTLKSNMWRRFTEDNTRRWVDMIPELLHDYNRTKHSSIGTSPLQASKKKNEKKIFDYQYSDIEEHLQEPQTKPKYKLGDYVRISRKKGIFEKGYLPNWTREIFKVVAIVHTTPRVYELADLKGEKIKGSFYEQDLQKTASTPSTDFLVEKVLDTRTIRGQKQLLVKWLGYSKNFNRWIKASDVTHTFKKDEVTVPAESPTKIASTPNDVSVRKSKRTIKPKRLFDA